MIRFSVPIPNIRRHRPKKLMLGTTPGTLEQTVELPAPEIHRITYSADKWEEERVPPEKLADALQPPAEGVAWVDIQGLGDLELVQQAGDLLGLHPLNREDIAHVHQRSKLVEHEDYVFILVRAVRRLPDGNVDNEQLSFVLMKGLLVTFQERPGDGFDAVRKRIRAGKGPIRRSGADYLTYALIDLAVDNFYPVLEAYGETMDLLDDEVLTDPGPETANAIHAMKRELRFFRRTVWPLREVLNTILRQECELIDPAVRVAFRDCYDHVVQVADSIEASRDRASDLGDLYLSTVGDKTNQVMRILTIIATIFIPLTFLCGIYGMNFDTTVSRYNMPELGWKYGYPAFWVLLGGITVGMLGFFRRKGWIGRRS